MIACHSLISRTPLFFSTVAILPLSVVPGGASRSGVSWRGSSRAGTAAAFKTTAHDPDINQPTIDAVATYFAEHRGEHYSPHVTIGVGTIDYLNALVAAPFPAFTFSAVGVSAYQFGNFGTAAEQLHSFKLTQ
jgi:hypothetical protein